MKRTSLLLASTALAMLLASGVALAIDKNCPRTGGYCVGTEEPDNLNGSERRDLISGYGADDTLLGNSGNDTVLGDGGNDTMSGGAGSDSFGDYWTEMEGNDTIRSGADYDYVYDTYGENKIYGQSGSDDLYGHGLLNGGKGDDYIRAYADGTGEGKTGTIVGGPGRDEISSPDYNLASHSIYADDGVRDTISCGGGTDTVYYDRRIDSVNTADCENLIRK